MSAAITTTSTHLPGQLFEVAEAMQSAELLVSEENRPNRISIAPDLEALEVTITVTLPLTMDGGANKITLTASDYLV